MNPDIHSSGPSPSLNPGVGVWVWGGGRRPWVWASEFRGAAPGTPTRRQPAPPRAPAPASPVPDPGFGPALPAPGSSPPSSRPSPLLFLRLPSPSLLPAPLSLLPVARTHPRLGLLSLSPAPFSPPPGAGVSCGGPAVPPGLPSGPGPPGARSRAGAGAEGAVEGEFWGGGPRRGRGAGGRGPQGPPQLWTSGCWGRPLRAGAGGPWDWWVGRLGAQASLPAPGTPVGAVGGSREAEGSRTSGTFCSR